jgi:hypothetical protein
VKQELIDYAYPMMIAEQKLKDAHLALLDSNNYDVGSDRLVEAIVEIKIAINSIKHMKEQSNGLRK